MSLNKASVAKLNEYQKKISKQTKNEDNPLQFLIGPANLYELLPLSQLKDSTLPWDDGKWDDGIYIDKGGKELRFNFNECEVEDVLKFIYFYFQFGSFLSKNPAEYKEVTLLLEEAQLKIKAGRIKDLIRKFNQK